MDKKHGVLEQEIQGHQSQVDSTLAAGAQLLADKHFASADIEAKCDDLKADWKNLGEATAERRKLLDLNLDVHQFFHDAAEVEGEQVKTLSPISDYTNLWGRRMQYRRKLVGCRKPTVAATRYNLAYPSPYEMCPRISVRGFVLRSLHRSVGQAFLKYRGNGVLRTIKHPNP